MRYFRISLLTLTHCMSLWLVVNGGCPPGCVCMWKSGKETTECVNRNKSKIPSGIEPSTQVLNIRGNDVRILENNIFLQLGITNLQKIYCSYCSIREVQPKAFRRLTNLIELDLSENSLKEIPTESWKHTKALMRLNLSGNPIKLIRRGAFKRLTFVTNLHLSHCDIETIEAGAFTSLEALLELKLENNKLNYLQGAILFPRSLHHIEIHGNPFHCDCRLLDFVRWIKDSKVPRSLEPTCHRPLRLENATIGELVLEDLACLPQVEPPVLKTVVVQGTQNVSLKCSVFGIPTAVISWWHANRLVSNGTVLDHPWEKQYYFVKEQKTNEHKITSEIIIFEVRPEDNGFFYCSASNPAGVVRANFTLEVIPKVGLDSEEAEEAALDVSSISTQDQSTEDSDMLKVEYILGFGAASVVVLTIIIILILYLVLQCRSRRCKHRLSRALHCDSNSNSNSFIERSTVDFIIPGEMELTSAVRSVSCNSTISKCNGNDSQKSRSDLEDNDDEDEAEYGGKRQTIPRALRNPIFAETQQTLRRSFGDGPPSYKPPPPPPTSTVGGEPLCHCCGEPQWKHPTMNMSFIPPRFVTPYREAQHVRDCPRNSMHLSHREDWSCGDFPQPFYTYFDGQGHYMPNGELQDDRLRYRSNSLRTPKKLHPNIIRPQNYRNNLHYVTMSRGAHGPPREDYIQRSTSQPHVNGSIGMPKSMNSMNPHHHNILTPISLETSITFPRSAVSSTTTTPRYPYLPRQVSRYQVNSHSRRPTIPRENDIKEQSSLNFRGYKEQCGKDSYLFPDLPPPPDAQLPSIRSGSRSSSLDDLSNDGRGSVMSSSSKPFYTLPNHHPPSSLSQGAPKRHHHHKTRNAEPAIKIDLSDSDKTIRLPASAPDLSQSSASSPVRSALRSNRQATLERSSSIDRRSIIMNNPKSSTANKKVMFTGVSDEGEDNSSSQDVPQNEDPVWVLRTDKREECQKPNNFHDENNVPVTGIVIAQPNKYVISSYPALIPPKITPNPLSSIPLTPVVVPSSHPHHSGGSDSSSGTISNPPSRLNPVRGGFTAGSSAGSSSSMTSVVTPPVINPQQPPNLRPGNPALQRHGLPNFHESPDEGYHEEDGGSETL